MNQNKRQTGNHSYGLLWEQLERGKLSIRSKTVVFLINRTLVSYLLLTGVQCLVKPLPLSDIMEKNLIQGWLNDGDQLNFQQSGKRLLPALDSIEQRRDMINTAFSYSFFPQRISMDFNLYENNKWKLRGDLKKRGINTEDNTSREQMPVSHPLGNKEESRANTKGNNPEKVVLDPLFFRDKEKRKRSASVFARSLKADIQNTNRTVFFNKNNNFLENMPSKSLSQMHVNNTSSFNYNNHYPHQSETTLKLLNNVSQQKNTVIHREIKRFQQRFYQIAQQQKQESRLTRQLLNETKALLIKDNKQQKQAVNIAERLGSDGSLFDV